MPGLHASRGIQSMTCPACMGQTVPSLTSPRVYKPPRGAGARLAGLDKQFFGYLILQKSGLRPVLPRPYNRLGSARQTKTWPNDPATQIVQDEPACAEKRYIVLVWWCTQVDPLGRIRVFDCLATAVASARIILASSNVVQWPFSAHCTRCIRVNWNRMLIFSFLGHQSWTRD